MKSPVITRRYAQRLQNEAVKAAVDESEAKSLQRESRLRDEGHKSRQALRQEYEERVRPVLRRMVEISGRPTSPLGDFVLHFNLDRYMVEQAAMTNDKVVWRYISEMIAHHIERELSQMNFAGLHKMAYEYERRMPRERYALPSSVGAML